jgi:hypothetical protein
MALLRSAKRWKRLKQIKVKLYTEQLFIQQRGKWVITRKFFFWLKDPIYLQSVTIHSANGGKGEGWHVEEYSVALLC